MKKSLFNNVQKTTVITCLCVFLLGLGKESKSQFDLQFFLDSLALVKMYDQTAQGTQWTNQDGWQITDRATTPVSEWYGVTVEATSDTTKRVTRLEMPGNNINGIMPNETANLTALKIINLENNGLVSFTGGPLPGLMFLDELDTILFANNLAQHFPNGFDDLASIRYADFSNNRIALNSIQAVHEGWFNPNVEYLDLRGNRYGDTIPNAIGNATSLKVLRLDSNWYNSVFAIDGAIPATIGQLTNLVELDLSDLKLEGSIPDVFDNLTSLEVVNLSNNELTGNFPSTLTSANLRSVELQENSLEGEIPTGLASSTNLVVFNVDDNQIGGDLPDFASTSLEVFRVGNNDFNGGNPVPAWIPNNTNIREIGLAGGGFTGSIGTEYQSLNNLEELDVSNNQLEDFPDLSAFAPLVLKLENNRFHFDDVCPNIGGSMITTYNPQDSLYEAETITAMLGATVELSSPVGGDFFTTYLWYKDGQLLPGSGIPQLDSVLSVGPITTDDAGVYTCEVTNFCAGVLKLWRRPITIEVDAITGQAEIDQTLTPTFFPNPSASGLFALSASNQVNRVEIFNGLGQRVIDANPQAISNTWEVDLSGFGKGLYTATITDKKGVVSVHKIIFK